MRRGEDQPVGWTGQTFTDLVPSQPGYPVQALLGRDADHNPFTETPIGQGSGGADSSLETRTLAD